MRPTWSLHSPSVTFLFHDFVKEMCLQDIRDSFWKLWVQYLQILSLGAGRNGERMGQGGREREGEVGMGNGQTEEGRDRRPASLGPCSSLNLESGPGLAQTQRDI